MKSIELFKLLQQHAAEINALAVGLYNGKIEADAAEKKAAAAVAKINKILSPGT